MKRLLRLPSNGATRRLASTSSRFPPAAIFEGIEPDTTSLNPDKPVIIKKHFCGIPAIAKWFTPFPTQAGFHELKASYLERYGSIVVPLELRRFKATESRGQQDSSFERFEAPLSLLIAHMTSSDTASALYLAQCALADLPAPLQADLPTPTLLALLGRGDIYASSLWMGRPPTRTPLHRDPNPNLFVQLAGRKVVRLMKPEHGRQLHERASRGNRHANLRGEEMMAGYELESLESAVWGEDNREYEDVNGVEATLDSGDALLIPLGWWHAVRGVGMGANASANWWFR